MVGGGQTDFPLQSSSVSTLNMSTVCSESPQPLSAHSQTNLNTEAWLHDTNELPYPSPISNCSQMIRMKLIPFPSPTLCLNNWENGKCLQHPRNHLRLDVSLWMSDMESGDMGLDLATQLRQEDHKLKVCLSRVSLRSAWATSGI